MKIDVVGAEQAAQARRLDCWYFLSPGRAAQASVTRAQARGLARVTVGGPGGLGRVWAPNRFKRTYAVPGEAAVPYLRPYDVFNFLPRPADWLSVRRTKNLASYQLRKGMILQTCSGRNLGPGVFVDSYLAGFALSHDMIRVEVKDTRLRNYLIAFLNSHTGRHLLRRDKTGSVIDHISVEHLERVEVVLLPAEETDAVAAMIAKAFRLRERARMGLAEMLKVVSESLPQVRRRTPRHEGWDVASTTLRGRLDTVYYDPLVAEIRRELKLRGGVCVGKVARVHKPGGRYKTRYVAAVNGRPLLSGGQLLQTYPINLQHISPDTFKNVTNYTLRKGWVAYPADGRAEEELGTPVLITPHRDGWLASGHVGRIEPLPGVNPGSLFLALATEHAQLQIKAASSGSVVDSTFSWDMEDVILPPLDDIDGRRATGFWNALGEAQAIEEAASATVDQALDRSTEQ